MCVVLLLGDIEEVQAGKMAKLPLSLLTTVLTFTFLFVGISKISGYINDDFHQEMVIKFCNVVFTFDIGDIRGIAPQN